MARRLEDESEKIFLRLEWGTISRERLRDSESASTLIHAFVSSRVDYCNTVFAGAPKIIIDRRVLNAAARVVSDTQKFDRGLSRLMHTELHWLDIPERVQYKLGVLMYRGQHNQAPRYLTDHCMPISDTVFRQRLRSASGHQVSVPRYRLSTYGRRAFSVAGPTVWNSLPEGMRDPECFVGSYRQSLKTFLFSQY